MVCSLEWVALARPLAILEAMVPQPRNPTESFCESGIILESWKAVSSLLLVYTVVGVDVDAIVGGVVGKDDGAP